MIQATCKTMSAILAATHNPASATAEELAQHTFRRWAQTRCSNALLVSHKHPTSKGAKMFHEDQSVSGMDCEMISYKTHFSLS